MKSEHVDVPGSSEWETVRPLGSRRLVVVLGPRVIVVNEAMACARSCIVTDRVGCGPDLVIPRKTGFIFPLGDVAALAESMVQFSVNPQVLTVMGIDARSRLKNYSVEKAVEGVIRSLEAGPEPRVWHASA